MKTAKCRTCGAEILWRKSQFGGNIPIDPFPCDKGNIVMLGDTECKVVAGWERDMRLRLRSTIYRAHWSTCAGAGMEEG